ncbi:hypothetical protein CN373_09410 [Bacillus cereus]|uniref:Uncharacterized protein n=2 Tax=Bacillus cereus group TaxID=86661 RepID=A0AA44QCF9_BACCE|nr:hypothetical protein [Bacillus cereus]EEL50482.1 hypothetical protein bcere0022_21940 [Bacillus cereus Rock3-44]PFA22790.1 hypothetical protein CN373_09410 [Bacillus cereus]PFN05145.1 hypothetical protein COJ55_19440 [Bacillus cereus]PFO79747.1 hypothetical protein COJ77_19125 [Bacillus cereus]PFR25017.1 hypothetical protein COK19_15965 [Bacillus cereus]
MYKVKNNRITDYTLQQWDEKFVPNTDYFYFREIPPYLPVQKREKVPLMLDERTAFLSWNVVLEARYIAVISNKEFKTLDDKVRNAILLEQVYVNRGFIFTLTELEQLHGESLRHLLAPYKLNQHENIILQRFIWDKLPKSLRIKVLIRIAEEFTNHESLLVEYQSFHKEYPYISRYFNTFVGVNGPNCLGAVAASIQQAPLAAEHFLNKWVLPEEFYKELKKNNYKRKCTVDIHRSNILVWEMNGQAVHACYMLSDEIAFNKNGQTMFNSYQCQKRDDVLETWNHVLTSGGELHIYEKCM